jgi:polyphosphate kinase
MNGSDGKSKSSATDTASRAGPEARGAGKPGRKKLDARRAGGAARRRAPRAEFTGPEFFPNRELTRLEFNWRVLHEAEDRRSRCSSGSSSSPSSARTDEFFMKRTGGLKQQVAAGVREPTIDGRTPQQQIVECYRLGGARPATPELHRPGAPPAQGRHPLTAIHHLDQKDRAPCAITTSRTPIRW